MLILRGLRRGRDREEILVGSLVAVVVVVEKSTVGLEEVEGRKLIVGGMGFVEQMEMEMEISKYYSQAGYLMGHIEAGTAAEGLCAQNLGLAVVDRKIDAGQEAAVGRNSAAGREAAVDTDHGLVVGDMMVVVELYIVVDVDSVADFEWRFGSR